MKFISTALAIAAVSLAGCVTSSNSYSSSKARTGKYSHDGFHWQDASKISANHAALVTPSGGAKLYMVSYAPPGPTVQLSNGRVLANATVMNCIRMAEPSYLIEECHNKVVNASRTSDYSDRASIVSAARLAIEAQGQCQWMGYDAGVDAQARAIGALASQRDNRLFFVGLRCS